MELISDCHREWLTEIEEAHKVCATLESALADEKKRLKRLKAAKGIAECEARIAEVMELIAEKRRWLDEESIQFFREAFDFEEHAVVAAFDSHHQQVTKPFVAVRVYARQLKDGSAYLSVWGDPFESEWDRTKQVQVSIAENNDDRYFGRLN